MLARTEFDPIAVINDHRAWRWLILSCSILVCMLLVVFLLQHERGDVFRVNSRIVAISPGFPVRFDPAALVEKSLVKSGDIVSKGQTLLLLRDAHDNGSTSTLTNLEQTATHYRNALATLSAATAPPTEKQLLSHFSDDHHVSADVKNSFVRLLANYHAVTALDQEILRIKNAIAALNGQYHVLRESANPEGREHAIAHETDGESVQDHQPSLQQLREGVVDRRVRLATAENSRKTRLAERPKALSSLTQALAAFVAQLDAEIIALKKQNESQLPKPETRVAAPFDGIVIISPSNASSMLSRARSPLVHVIPIPQRAQVELIFPDPDAQRMRAGQSIQIYVTDPASGKTFGYAATVTAVQLDPIRFTNSLLSIELNSQELERWMHEGVAKPGGSAEVTFRDQRPWLRFAQNAL